MNEYNEHLLKLTGKIRDLESLLRVANERGRQALLREQRALDDQRRMQGIFGEIWADLWKLFPNGAPGINLREVVKNLVVSARGLNNARADIAEQRLKEVMAAAGNMFVVDNCRREIAAKNEQIARLKDNIAILHAQRAHGETDHHRLFAGDPDTDQSETLYNKIRLFIENSYRKINELERRPPTIVHHSVTSCSVVDDLRKQIKERDDIMDRMKSSVTEAMQYLPNVRNCIASLESQLETSRGRLRDVYNLVTGF